MKILVCGANGQVGRDIINRAPAFGLEAIGLDRSQLDITQADQVEQAVLRYRPALIINSAAYTNVDGAETDQALADAVNRDGPGNLAAVAQKYGIALLHISTDYVFSGEAKTPYRETDTTGPTGVYGASKLAGEAMIQDRLAKHVILRTSWVYGIHGNNFVKTMLRVGAQRDELSVVCDQFGCPTKASTIAETLLELARRYKRQGDLPWGLYHYSGRSPCSWYDFAVEIFQQAQAQGLLENRPTVFAIPTSEYPTPAQRPLWSVLDCTRFESTFGLPTRDWRDELTGVIGHLAQVERSAQQMEQRARA